MNAWKVILATLVIFGAGVITGGLLVSYSDRALHHPPRGTSSTENQWSRVGPAGGGREGRLPPPVNTPLRKEFLDRLNRELKLSPGQRARIEKILIAGQERIRNCRQEIEPQISAELADTKNKIRAVLTPEQQVRFAELLRRRPHEQRRPGPYRGHSQTNPPAPAP